MDLSTLFGPSTLGGTATSQLVHLSITPSDPTYDDTYANHLTAGDLSNVPLQATSNVHDFVITAWLDTDRDGYYEYYEPKREIDVHVVTGNLTLYEPDESAVPDDQEVSPGGEVDFGGSDVVPLDVQSLSGGVPGKFVLCYTSSHIEVFADAACTQPIPSGAPAIDPTSCTRVYVKGLSVSDDIGDESIELYYSPRGVPISPMADSEAANFVAFADAVSPMAAQPQGGPLDRVNATVIGIKRDGGAKADVILWVTDFDHPTRL